ncbi:PH domain-containing protein [Virgibacillus necropolis]|uniref:PH domain-containing protein n=1 Tax=Virgibacillus necropolis TaxID=163877 RepID=UPI003850DA97
MSEKQRLHPAAIFFTLIKTFKELIFSIGIGFFALKDAGLIYFVIGTCVLIIGAIVFSTLSWYRYTYRIEEEELRIEYGIFVRKKRYISKNRIQSIDLTQSVAHRIFKLVQVKIETAGSGIGTEASLKAVKLQIGESLREELKTLQKTNIETDESIDETVQDKPSQKITAKRLFFAGTTSGSIGIIFVIMSVLFSELGQFIPEGYYENTFHTIISFSIIIIVVLVLASLLLLWFLGIAGTMIKYGNFTITKNEDELFIARGLLEKKQTTIPIRRIQAVGIDESLLRQPFGYVTVYAEIAGGSMEKGEDFSTILFPIMKRTEVDDFLEKFLPEYISERNNLNGLPAQAKTFYIIRSTIVLILAIIAMLFFIPQFIWAPTILLILCMFMGLLRYKDAGFRINEEQLTLRYRVLNRKTVILFHKRIQSFERKQYLLQQKASIATMKTSIVSKYGAGKHYKIKDLAVGDVMELADWYSYRD